VAALLPQSGVQLLEKLQRLKVPAEPEVEGDLPEGFQTFRDSGNYGNMERPLLGRLDGLCHKGVRMKKLPSGDQQFLRKLSRIFNL
jgi:hypothetical protein